MKLFAPSLLVHQELHPPSYSTPPSVSGSDSYVQHNPADQLLPVASIDVIEQTSTDTAGVLVTFSHLFIAAAVKPLYS